MKRNNKILVLLLLVVLACSLVVFTACKPDPQIDPDPSRAGAYCLTDKATFLTFKNGSTDKLPNLSVLFEADNDLKNTYSMIAVDPNGSGFTTTPELNTVGADCFIKWMSMASTREKIAAYGDTYGTSFGGALFYLVENAQTYTGSVSDISYTTGSKVIKLSTTTSVNDSRLLSNSLDTEVDSLEKDFEEATGWDLQISSKGTGAAIEDAKRGAADVLLVHSKSQEEAFINGGFSRTVAGLTGNPVDSVNAARIPFMYNYFVLVGTTSDPAGVKKAANIKDAFKLIAEKGIFISRGDKSGTHTKEISLWNPELKITADTSKLPDYTWYISSGLGMGYCLTMTNVYSARYPAAA